MKETKFTIGIDDTLIELTEKDINMEILIYMFKAIAAIDKKLDEKKPIEENKRTLTIVTKFKAEHFELLETVLKSSAEIKRLQEENNLLLRKCFDRNSIQIGERISHNPEPDKNIFNKIGLEFIKFENQMKELGIDPKKFGVNEFLNSICKVVKENLIPN
jgi:hypothetical protein